MGRVHQGEGALGVAKLPTPDHLESATERHPHDLDHLVRFQALRDGLELEGREEVDALIGEARCGPDLAEALDSSRALARLLFQLSGRAQRGILASIELAGGDFENRSAGRMAELMDQQHVLRAHEGHDGGGAGMAHDIEGDAAPVREQDLVGVDLDGSPAVSRRASHERALARVRLEARRAGVRRFAGRRVAVRARALSGHGHSGRSGQVSHWGRRAMQQTRPWWITRWE